MKALIFFAAITLFTLTSSFTIDVHPNLNQKTFSSGCFNYFRAHRQSKMRVAMVWAVSTSDIREFIVERSYGEDYWEKIGSMNFDGSRSYKFSDISPFAGTGIYRIKAVKADGSSEYSSTETAKIVIRK